MAPTLSSLPQSLSYFLGDEEESLEDTERAKALAEKLRDMIREGISDECSICLSEFDHPVITPCAHVYCRPCIVQTIGEYSPKISEIIHPFFLFF